MLRAVAKNVESLRKKSNKNLKGPYSLFSIGAEFKIIFTFIRFFKLSEKPIYFYKLYATYISGCLTNLKQ